MGTKTTTVMTQNNTPFRISSFPFLTPNEFNAVCNAFISRFSRNDSGQGNWNTVSTVHHGDETYLKITRLLSLTPSSIAIRTNQAAVEHSTSEEVVEEKDEEAYLRDREHIAAKREYTVQYDTILSRSYQVPILYFSLHDAAGNPIRDIDTVYELLVPDAYKRQLSNVGVMGGISIANHPITDVPTLFIHPCQTADALREISGGRAVSVEEYLLLWIGIIGGSVGLNVTANLVTVPQTLKANE